MGRHCCSDHGIGLGTKDLESKLCFQNMMDDVGIWSHQLRKRDGLIQEIPLITPDFVPNLQTSVKTWKYRGNGDFYCNALQLVQWWCNNTNHHSRAAVVQQQKSSQQYENTAASFVTSPNPMFGVPRELEVANTLWCSQATIDSKHSEPCCEHFVPQPNQPFASKNVQKQNC